MSMDSKNTFALGFGQGNEINRRLILNNGAINDFRFCSSENIPRMSVFRYVGLNGFHRTLETNFAVENLHSEFKECKWAMDQTISSGAYVDPYQIEEYQRTNKIPHKIQIIGDVDIEAAQPNAADHRVLVFFNESAMEFKDKLNAEFPFHLRYHRAKSGGGSVVVNVKHPMLLVRCKGMMPTDIVKAPCCYMCDYCDWNIIQSLKTTDDNLLQVPVGNIDHKQLVTIVTLIMILGGCYYIISPVSEAIKF